MSIDITNNINLDAAGGSLEPAKNTDLADKGPQAGAADSTLRAEYESFIRKALELEDTDSKAVDEARQALESGRLDTPEGAQSAAENILKSGI
jgi:hypothetical protein